MSGSIFKDNISLQKSIHINSKLKDFFYKKSALQENIIKYFHSMAIEMNSILI